jgi:hypothetical protein
MAREVGYLAPLVEWTKKLTGQQESEITVIHSKRFRDTASAQVRTIQVERSFDKVISSLIELPVIMGEYTVPPTASKSLPCARRFTF